MQWGENHAGRRSRSVMRDYAGFLALVGAILAVLFVLGVVPTRRYGGDGAVVAMVAGLAVSTFASLAGSAPLLLRRGGPPSAAATAMLGSIALRLPMVLLLGSLLAFSGLVAPVPFLLWLVLAHAALLIPDTLLALRATRERGPLDPDQGSRRSAAPRSLSAASET